MKRLAIDASALDRLPLLLGLEELVLQNPTVDIVSSLERICPQGLSLLTLVGAHDELYAIDTSSLSVNTQVAFVVTSPPQVESDELDSANLRRSSRSSLAAITLNLDDSWTNATLNSSICVSDPSTVNSITLTCASAAEKWFRLPTCVSTFPVLSIITITRCQMPVFNAFPGSLVNIIFQDLYGTWTQREAGIDPMGPNADYFDWSWLSSVPRLNFIGISPLSFNGTMPNEFNHSKVSSWNVDISSIAGASALRLVGTIAPDWFTRYPGTQSLSAYDHNLTGTIPYYGLEKLQSLLLSYNEFTHWPPLIVNTTAGFGPPSLLRNVYLQSNNLVQIPLESDFQSMAVTTLLIDSNPSLFAPFPNLFATSTTKTSSTLVKTISATGCQFYGDLPEIPAYQAALYNAASPSLFMRFNSNLLNGTIPSSWSNVTMNWAILPDNPLTGTVATVDSNGFITSAPPAKASVLFLSSDHLTGPMFNISAMSSLSELRLTLPNVDFCASYRSGHSFTSTTLSQCEIHGNASMCPSAYPQACTIIPVPLAPFLTPVEIPSIQTPTNVPNAKTCPFPSPGPLFTCLDGAWISYDSVDVGTLSLPRSSVTIIQGNLTTSSLIIASATSNISVTGCTATSEGTVTPITVTLEQEDLDEIIRRGGKLTTVLLQQSSECSAIGASVVNVDTRAIKSCKKIETNKISSSSTISMAFRVSNNGCNTWWIILVSVVCGVIILAIVVVVILAIVWRPFREKIRPFSRKRQGTSMAA